MKKFNESDYIYKANNNKLLNESSFTIEEFCYDNDIEDPKTFIRILRQLCDFDDIEQADNSLLRKALVKYQQTLKESSDYIYKAKIGDKLYLQGNSQDGWDTTSDLDEAATFESKTEPTQIFNQMKKDNKIRKNDKITVMKEYVSIQTINTFMKHGVEKYFHEYVIVIDDDWYTPCEFISEFGLEDSFGPEYVFEQVVIAVKSSIKWLKKQGFKPDEDSDDESYNLYMMIDFIKNIKELNQLNESGGLFDYVLNESSSLKESECSLEWLLDKAYVSEYRMVGKNSAEVRVRHTPELLTSESMAARFEEDIPDGYRLEVDYLGEDPILGRNFDIYEVQLVKY